MTKHACYRCERTQEAVVVVENDKIVMKGVEVEHQYKAYKCCVCGAETMTAEMLDWTLASARKAYNKIMEESVTKRENFYLTLGILLCLVTIVGLGLFLMAVVGY
jgi:hypothetical protein